MLIPVTVLVWDQRHVYRAEIRGEVVETSAEKREEMIDLNKYLGHDYHPVNRAGHPQTPRRVLVQ